MVVRGTYSLALIGVPARRCPGLATVASTAGLPPGVGPTRWRPRRSPSARYMRQRAILSRAHSPAAEHLRRWWTLLGAPCEKNRTARPPCPPLAAGSPVARRAAPLPYVTSVLAQSRYG